MQRMNLLRKIVLVRLMSLLLAGLPGSVFAGAGVWTTHGPEGGSVPALAIDPKTPSTLYAGTACAGVFKSTDGGAHWNAINTGLHGVNVRALAIDPLTPATLYAGSWFDGASRARTAAHTGATS